MHHQSRLSSVSLLAALVLNLIASTPDLLAQAPNSVGGSTIELVISSGSGGLAPSGTYRFLASAIDSSYAVVPVVGNIAASSGYYFYMTTAYSTATLQFNDDRQGPGFVATCNFTTPVAGTFRIANSISPAVAQQGTFTIYAGQPPPSIAGSTITLAVTSGIFPFAAAGSARLLPSFDGSYKIVGVSGVKNSAGTYTYKVTSPATAMLTISDSLLGSSQAEIFFSSATSGTYYFEIAGTPLQTGTFTYNLPAATAPILSAPHLIGSQLQFTIAAQAGYGYTVEFTTTLAPAAWQTLVSIPASGLAVNVVVTDPLGNGRRYYRARTP